MAEALTIARPYAEATFKLASQSGADSGAQLASWADALGRLASVVQRPELQRLLGDPKVSPAQLAGLLSDAAGSLNEQQKNFVSLLSTNERVNVLPEVAQQFAQLRAKFEDTLEAEVTSAYPLSDTQLGQIVETLRTKFGKKVKATVHVDPALIGGVSIRIGDEVTDVSVRGKLAQLKASLTQ